MDDSIFRLLYFCLQNVLKYYQRFTGYNQISKMQAQGSQYEVEEIIAEKVFQGKPHFLIKWKGYPKNQSTWEPIENLQHCIHFLISWKKQKTRDQLKEKSEKTTKKSPVKPKGGRKIICKQGQDFKADLVTSNQSKLMVSLNSKPVLLEESKELKTSQAQVTTRKGLSKKVEEKKPKKTIIQIEDDIDIEQKVQHVDVQKLRNQKLDFNAFEQTKDPEKSETAAQNNYEIEQRINIAEKQNIAEKEQHFSSQKNHYVPQNSSESNHTFSQDLQKLDSNHIQNPVDKVERQQGQLQIIQELPQKENEHNVSAEINLIQGSHSNGYSFRSAPVFATNNQISRTEQGSSQANRKIVADNIGLPSMTKNTAWLQKARNENFGMVEQVDSMVAQPHSQHQMVQLKDKQQLIPKIKTVEQQKNEIIQIMEEPQSRETNIEKVKEFDQKCILGIDKIGIHNGKKKCKLILQDGGIGLISLRKVRNSHPNVLMDYFMSLTYSDPRFNQLFDDKEFE